MSHEEIITLSVLPNLEILLQVLKHLDLFYKPYILVVEGICGLSWITLEKKQGLKFHKADDHKRSVHDAEQK